LSRSTSPDAIAAIFGRMLAANRQVVQNSSKSANVRCTVMSRGQRPSHFSIFLRLLPTFLTTFLTTFFTALFDVPIFFAS